jgi:hypothetical protein
VIHQPATHPLAHARKNITSPGHMADHMRHNLGALRISRVIAIGHGDDVRHEAGYHVFDGSFGRVCACKAAAERRDLAQYDKGRMLDTFNSLGVYFRGELSAFLRIILSLYAETNACNMLQREGHASQSKGKCLSIENNSSHATFRDCKNGDQQMMRLRAALPNSPARLRRFPTLPPANLRPSWRRRPPVALPPPLLS